MEIPQTRGQSNPTIQQTKGSANQNSLVQEVQRKPSSRQHEEPQSQFSAPQRQSGHTIQRQTSRGKTMLESIPQSPVSPVNPGFRTISPESNNSAFVPDRQDSPPAMQERSERRTSRERHVSEKKSSSRVSGNGGGKRSSKHQARSSGHHSENGNGGAVSNYRDSTTEPFSPVSAGRPSTSDSSRSSFGHVNRDYVEEDRTRSVRDRGSDEGRRSRKRVEKREGSMDRSERRTRTKKTSRDTEFVHESESPNGRGFVHDTYR